MERRRSRHGQFHHYVPRFVVRRWLQEVKTVTSPGRKPKGRYKGRQRTREYTQELINTYDIQSNTLHLGTTDIGKTFGVADMYKDDADPTDAYRIEKAFSKLESAAARVIQVLEDAEMQGRSSVELDRAQLNTLRKFLFLIHYRSGRHAGQFIEGRFDPASARMVEQYRIKHGLADARAVWLRNLARFLEDEHWDVPTDERLLYTARMDYKLEALDMQPGFYRAPSGNEFVLTENGLGLTEGASRTSTSFIVDMMSLGAPRAALTLTQSFPITPKLVIILRSPVAEQARCQAYEGPGGISYFDDIPRTSPKTTYIPPFPPGSYDWEQRRPEKMSAEDRKKKEDFQVRGLLNGVPLGSRLRDRFIFAIEDLTEDQAQRVNTLLLTHCKETISFYTPACLVRAIDAFERDTMLTIFEKKRYGSLKAKLLAEGTRPSPMPTSPSPPASPGGEHSPRKLTPTSPDPSGSELAAQALSMGTSLVLGFKGAFSRKARSAPTSNVQDASVGEPASLTAQTVVSQEQARLDVSHTEVLRGSTLANVDTTQITPVDNTPHITGEPPLPPVIHDRASNDQPFAREVNVPGLTHDGLPPSVAKMAPSAPAIAAQWIGLHAALPGLRGAFKRRPNVISTETPSLIATQPLLASPAPLLQPTIDVSQSPDSEARPKAQADIDTASASSPESSAESYMDSTRTDLGSEAHLDPSTGHPVEQYTETNTDSRDGTYRGTHSTPEPRSSSARWFVSRMLWTKPAKLAKAVASIFCCCK